MKHGRTSYLNLEQRIKRLEHLLVRQREMTHTINERVREIKDMRRHYIGRRVLERLEKRLKRASA